MTEGKGGVGAGGIFAEKVKERTEASEAEE